KRLLSQGQAKFLQTLLEQPGPFRPRLVHIRGRDSGKHLIVKVKCLGRRQLTNGRSIAWIAMAAGAVEISQAGGVAVATFRLIAIAPQQFFITARSFEPVAPLFARPGLETKVVRLLDSWSTKCRGVQEQRKKQTSQTKNRLEPVQ